MDATLEKDIFGRTALLLGDSAMSALGKARVIIFGVGGVGSWCAEGLIRSGITNLTIVDSDMVSVTNVNRQSMATTKTIGRVKVDALKERLLDINPRALITPVRKVYSEETANDFDLDSYDYIVDAIDSLKDKTYLIMRGAAAKGKLYCAMGAALKLDPTKIRVADFWEVRGCPLAAALRKKMHRMGIGSLPQKSIPCVYDEEVLENRGLSLEDPAQAQAGSTTKARINGTTAHITAIFGFTLSGLIISDIVSSLEGR